MGAQQQVLSAEAIAEIATKAAIAAISAALTGEEPAKESKAPKARKASKADDTVEDVTLAGAFKRLSKEDFKALKVGGIVPWGMTQKDAHAAGLIGKNADGTPKVRTTKVAPKAAKAKQAKARKTPKVVVERKSAVSWGKSFTAHVRTSGLYVGTETTRGVHWESLSKVVSEGWKGLVTPLHEQGMSPKDAFEEVQAQLMSEGFHVEHYSNAKGAQRARRASQKRFAERLAG